MCNTKHRSREVVSLLRGFCGKFLRMKRESEKYKNVNEKKPKRNQKWFCSDTSRLSVSSRVEVQVHVLFIVRQLRVQVHVQT